MPSDPLTILAFNEFKDGLNERLDKEHEILLEIRDHVKTTNGRVTALERQRGIDEAVRRDRETQLEAMRKEREQQLERKARRVDVALAVLSLLVMAIGIVVGSAVT